MKLFSLFAGWLRAHAGLGLNFGNGNDLSLIGGRVSTGKHGDSLDLQHAVDGHQMAHANQRARREVTTEDLFSNLEEFRTKTHVGYEYRHRHDVVERSAGGFQ